MARGNVLRGSTTSPAIMGASSRPAKPKQRLAKNSTVGSWLNDGSSACRVDGRWRSPRAAVPRYPTIASASAGSPRGQSADVLQPAAALEADDVEEQRHREQSERRAGGVGRTLFECRKPEVEDIKRKHDGRQRQRREVEDIGGPVEPPDQKPLPRTEGPRCPDVQAALFGQSRCERGDGESLRYEEHQRGQQPKE